MLKLGVLFAAVRFRPPAVEEKMTTLRTVLLALAAASLLAAAQEVEETAFGGQSHAELDAAFRATPKLLCQACNVAVTEMWRANEGLREDVAALSVAKRRERETDIFGAMDSYFCAEGAAIRYVLNPYTYGRACKAFLERFNEDFEVEARLVAGVAGSHYHDLASSVCRDACKGIADADRVPADAPRDAPRQQVPEGFREL